jgi:hypothetical protein
MQNLSILFSQRQRKGRHDHQHEVRTDQGATPPLRGTAVSVSGTTKDATQEQKQHEKQRDAAASSQEQKGQDKKHEC